MAQVQMGRPLSPLDIPSFNSLDRVKRMLRRKELRLVVPLADTTIYEMERRGEFPRRFNLTPRCVVWDLAEVEAWIDQRRKDSDARLARRTSETDMSGQITSANRAAGKIAGTVQTDVTIPLLSVARSEVSSPTWQLKRSFV
ncbi:MAG: AlpA family phage regulatory protein [Aestuariivirga sp.]|uniref:helix-turn-helix transcriptional regulator n=1 Tax=Aestuariivirga sp. TaxID=2650926 RepID=UPI003018E21B